MLYKHQSEALRRTEGKNRAPISGYEGIYEIDEEGLIYCILNDKYHKIRILKPHLNNSGYLRVNLYDMNHRPKKHYIHRLVAQTFIPNPDNLKYVDHKDCSKLNNSVNNLEWVTQKENIRRSVQKGLQNQYFCTVDDVQYASMSEASDKIFGNKWFIKELRYKYGNEFTYEGHNIKVVM